MRPPSPRAPHALRTPLALFRTLLLCFALSLALAADGPAAKLAFDLPAGDARPMLRQFAAQAKREIVFPTGSVEGIRTNAVRGEMTPPEAVNQMLAGTGLV